ncbi:MAG: putative Ig domain-containing protein [Candidatus Acidiferrales bacterium]
MRSISRLDICLTAAFLLLCGCGSSSGGGGGSTPAPSALSYTTGTAVYTVGIAIPADNPTSSGGAVSSYSVSPALPAGLSLSASTGVIGGTPTAVTATASYTVTASNSGGSTTASLSITVVDASPAGLAYSTNPAVYTLGVAIAPDTPSSTGGAVTSYDVNPVLPSGLSLSNTTGVISGTPKTAVATGIYTVTAFNPGGSTTASISITVNNAGPANLAYTTNPALYTVGATITANSPSSTGGPVTSYSVNPALPAGLNLNTMTGVIGGTPTTATAAANYTVTAANAIGSTMATLNFTVNNAAAASLIYIPSTEVYTVGMEIAPSTPTDSAGAATYSVIPALPEGLSLDSATGTISGTPSKVTPTETYTVTASGSTGDALATLSITVDDVGTSSELVPNMDQTITPLAPQGSQFQQLNPDLPDRPDWLASHAVTSVVSPDGNTLLVLTSGFNRVYNDASNSLMSFEAADSNEYVFIYDISTNTPIKKQVIQLVSSYHGIAFDPTSNAHFYVGGCAFDNVQSFTLNSMTGIWAEDLNGSSQPVLAMAHHTGNGLPVLPPVSGVPINSQVFVFPCAAGVALSADAYKLVVANYYNDSISVFTGGYGNWQPATPSLVPNIDLRPGKAASAAMPGTPGGEFPFWVVVTGGGTFGPTYTAYVSSIRDREIDVVNLSLTPPLVTARIDVKGQPNKMTLNKAQTLLYVAEDQSDTVDVIDINATHATVNTVLESIPAIAPPAGSAGAMPPALAQYTGANTNSVTLSADETRLYVTNGNLNNVAVVALTGTNRGDHVIGLIPTGWYPNSVSLSGDGTWMYVINGKSPSGSNPEWCYGYGPTNFEPNCFATNEYVAQLTKAGLQAFPVPGTAQLSTLTNRVAMNNRFSSTESAGDAATMAAVSKGVKHVIFIIKENRTYDQVLGDLVNAQGVPIGHGEPDLVQWGQANTPNLHQLARTFVTLDNTLATSEVSYDGWLWTTSARAPDVVEHQFPVAYATRGLSLESEGYNRSINVAIPTVAGRMAANPLMPDDPDLLPGQTDESAPDGPNDEINTGYLWDAALRAGLTVRDYGFFIDVTCYFESACQIPLAHDPAATQTVVAYSTNVSLTPYTDPYFRGFDPTFPDYYRFKEWEREFDANYATGGLPSLSLVRLMNDHTGNFGTAIDLVNTPEMQEADNDYAVGLLVQKIANSIYAQNTLIFVIEDDAQDGADHIDAHRTVAFVAGAYVKQGAVVSTAYTTLDFVRTIEEVLGIKQWLNLNDALAHPMADVFNTTPSAWSFTAVPSCFLYSTQLPLEPNAACPQALKPTHDAAYWARVTKGLDFRDADRVDGALYNRILWKGMMGNRPYPAAPARIKFTANRAASPASSRHSAKRKAARKPATPKD